MYRQSWSLVDSTFRPAAVKPTDSNPTRTQIFRGRSRLPQLAACNADGNDNVPPPMDPSFPLSTNEIYELVAAVSGLGVTGLVGYLAVSRARARRRAQIEEAGEGPRREVEAEAAEPELEEAPEKAAPIGAVRGARARLARGAHEDLASPRRPRRGVACRRGRRPSPRRNARRQPNAPARPEGSARPSRAHPRRSSRSRRRPRRSRSRAQNRSRRQKEAKKDVAALAPGPGAHAVGLDLAPRRGLRRAQGARSRASSTRSRRCC